MDALEVMAFGTMLAGSVIGGILCKGIALTGEVKYWQEFCPGSTYNKELSKSLDRSGAGIMFSEIPHDIYQGLKNWAKFELTEFPTFRAAYHSLAKKAHQKP